MAWAWALPRQVLTAGVVQLRKRYRELKNRYGPRYASAMLSVAFFTFFSPLPGSLLVAVALIVAIAEIHRAVSRRSGLPEAIADRVCEVKAHMPFWATGRWPLPPC